jgi:hypothetical protein
VFRIPSNGNFFDHAIVEMCRQREIRLVAASIMSFDERYRNLNRFPYDVLTVLGEEQVEIIGRLKMARAVIPVGQPDLDEAWRKWSRPQSERYVEQRLGFGRARKLVLVATSALAPDSELQWMEALGEFAKRRGDVDILIKLHPATPAGRYDALRGTRTDWPLHVVSDPEIMPFLVVADVVLTDASHAGKQAIFLDKPLIAVNMTGEPFPYNRFDQDGVAVLSRSVDDLLRDLGRMLDDPQAALASLPGDRRAYIRRHLTDNDGHASDRIAALLLDPDKIGRAPAAQADAGRTS